MNKEKRIDNKMLEDFKLIKREIKVMKDLDVHPTKDMYWVHFEVVKNMLRKFLNDHSHSFIGLPKKEFLLLIHYVSIMRPVEPFQFMCAVSALVEGYWS